ncbi:pectate lyase family protein [Marinimicrobium agarilyticum]|uniref:pectate lyase family protein n=1 Tax=Marinimicrobium agarilyticum TaxID=306546 RepID=UPI0003F5D648|nr:pectate lyase [Marinimicrobium agarilyticum]
MTLNKLALVTAMSAVLTACGGSSSGGDNSSSSLSSSEASSSESSGSSQSSAGSEPTTGILSCENANRIQGFAAMGDGTTGGAGGTEVTVTSGQELVAALSNKGSEPLTIYVDGTITPDGVSDGKFNIKDMNDVSIIGVEDRALFDGIGIKITRAHNVIIRNVTMRYVNIGDKDHISLEGPATHIWIDHNTFYNSLDSEKDFYDELVSGKRSVDNVTISYNILRDSWKTSLWGSSDSDNFERRITFYGNHWSNVNSRLPLFRFGQAHIFNNYYQTVLSTAINSRMGATIRIEGNVFEDVQNPIVAFYSEEVGYWDLEDNLFIDVTWTEGDGVTAGPNPESTVSYTPAYDYDKLSAEDTKAHVLNNAGAGVITDCL